MKIMVDDCYHYAKLIQYQRNQKNSCSKGHKFDWYEYEDETDENEPQKDCAQDRVKTMKGVHCYDVLANNRYAASLNYVSADNTHRNQYILDGDSDDDNDHFQSDLVRAVLGLAYLKDGQNFEFTVDYM